MSVFGWSYPAGAANDPFAPYNQTDEPCGCCGRFPDDCICPECPTCGSVGDPDCYDKHGMVRSQAQIESLAHAEAEWAKTAEAWHDA